MQLSIITNGYKNFILKTQKASSRFLKNVPGQKIQNAYSTFLVHIHTYNIIELYHGITI